VLMTLASLLLISGCTDKSRGIQYFISQDGAGNAKGTQDDPFASIHAAIKTVSQQKDIDADTITFSLFGGTHYLKQPVILWPEMNPGGRVVWKFEAFPGTQPVLSGAVVVTGWELFDSGQNIYRAKLDSTYRSRQLYVNGTRATRARTSGYPSGFKPNYDTTDKNLNGIQFKFLTTPEPRKNPANWSNLNRIQAVMQFQWKMISVPVDTINEYYGLLSVKKTAWDNANLYLDPDGKKPGMWSFWRVSFFENCYEFLDEEGEWYLNESSNYLYYKPRQGEDMATALVELPVLETLIEGQGTPTDTLSNVMFSKVGFAHTTWMTPDSEIGYVSDQSGCYVVGKNNPPNTTGHVKDVQRTPGSLRFNYSQHITFRDCWFEHIGSVAMDFGLGCKHNQVDHNRFTDISSAAVQLGGVDVNFHHPENENMILQYNSITNNTIRYTAREYVDAAAIFAGFTQYSDISHNHISNTSWAGIALGWGWGLLDSSGYPGLAGATWHMWGHFDSPTPNNYNRVTYNRIESFIENRWDGGMIYTTGQQGQHAAGALLIKGNVGHNKKTLGGGNTIYTDGGSRYINVVRNASYNNPIGIMDMGAPIDPLDLMKPAYWILSELTMLKLPYGGDCGGCRTYGDITWKDNYWNEGGIPNTEKYDDIDVDILKILLHNASLDSLTLYSGNGFFNICPFWDEVTKRGYPTDTTFINNHNIPDKGAIPVSLLDSAGVQN